MFAFCFISQNGNSGFQIWRLDIGNKSAFKPATQPIFQGFDLTRRPVRAKDDLFLRAVQSIKGMEKFFLRAFFLGNKLNIIDEQNINIAVFISKFLVFIAADGIDQFIGESFTGDLEHFCFRIFIQDIMGNRMHQMGFAQTYISI